MRTWCWVGCSQPAHALLSQTRPWSWEWRSPALCRSIPIVCCTYMMSWCWNRRWRDHWPWWWVAAPRLFWEDWCRSSYTRCGRVLRGRWLFCRSWSVRLWAAACEGTVWAWLWLFIMFWAMEVCPMVCSYWGYRVRGWGWGVERATGLWRAFIIWPMVI